MLNMARNDLWFEVFLLNPGQNVVLSAFTNCVVSQGIGKQYIFFIWCHLAKVQIVNKLYEEIVKL